MSSAVCKRGDRSGSTANAGCDPGQLFDTAELDECIEAYQYDLPEDRIAQKPAENRENSRLLAHHRDDGWTRHLRFADLPDLLDEGDLLVINDTRVLPARIRARRGTGARVEVLLLEPMGEERGEGSWEALVRPSARVRPGEQVWPLGGGPAVRVGEVTNGGHRRVFLPPDLDLEQVGEPPLPPYIRRPQGIEPQDRERYQTVYARRDGAVAAPTAGLHFTRGLFAELAERGVEVSPVTLHVGVGTFEPVRCTRLDDHAMHGERYQVPVQTCEAMAAARARGNRIVAVGTTVVRTLESWCLEGSPVDGEMRISTLFIKPGFRFGVIGAMITNFHLPRSTLLALVSAWAGRERVLRLYRDAVERGYRFYSYGDAMLLL